MGRPSELPEMTKKREKRILSGCVKEAGEGSEMSSPSKST